MKQEIIPKHLRDRVLMGTQVKVAFIAINVILVAALSALTIISVDRIFTSLTPVHEQNLRWKAERGAAELSRSLDLGILLGDKKLIREATRGYEADGELSLLLVQDPAGATLYRFQKKAVQGDLFQGAPLTAQLSGDTLRSWADVTVEGTRAGRVGVVFSTHKLKAGQKLRSNIMNMAVLGCLAALVVSAVFVLFYVRPLVQGTQSAFFQLEGKTIEALEASRVKGEFLANMSHEIRTPLNAIVGLAGLMLRGHLSATQRRRAEMISTSSESLLELINDVLDFSRLEAGKYEIHPERCDLRMLVQDRVELLAVRAQAKQIEIVYRVAPEVPSMVMADRARVAQVLTNLVGNAVKFTDMGEVCVRVSATPLEGDKPRVALRFEVTDTGAGIPASKIGKLFQSFSQVDASLTRAHEGSGLGLAISKELVDLMGGKIGAESEEGKGSKFWFTVPTDVLEESSRPAQQFPMATSRRVLVVDESAAVREVLTERMRSWGMEVLDAGSGPAALNLLREAKEQGQQIQFAVVDSKVVSEDGQPLWKSLRGAADETLRIVLLAPGSWATEGSDQQGIQRVSKPVRASDLYNCMADIRPAPAAEDRPIHARPGHFLVVDDNHVNRVVAEDTLQELGYTCDLARDGREAVQKALARKYDAILMDCQMPGMNGYQATHEIRQREEALGRRTPIIALTAHAFQGEREKARSAGMDDFLTKPASAVVLGHTLERWMTPTDGLPEQAPANDTAPVETQQPSQDKAPQELPLVQDQKRSIRLIEAFLSAAPEQVARLVELCAGGDPQALRAASHKLKGSAWSLGAMRMGKLCESIQLAVDTGDLTHVPEWGFEVEHVFTQTEAYLRAELLSRRPEPEARAASGAPPRRS